MTRTFLAAALGAALTLLFVGITGARPRGREIDRPASAKVINPPVEYRFFVPPSSAAFTAVHEKDLDKLGAQGWRVVAPIYLGGMLNSYLLMRNKQ